MRLISCHIENFGVLENKDINFSKGLNAYYKENGIGKTTLAAFIKAMFYGFDNKENKEFPDRLHYYPFKGGNVNYGGNLIFEFKNEIYRIEANFDSKSEKKDIIEVKDSKGNLILLDKKPGEYFFGIDLKSFTRTIYVSSNDLLIESTDSINKKLGGFVNDIDEAKLNKKIADKIKELESTRKNSLGIIEKYNLEINRLEGRILETNKLAEALPDKYIEYEKIEKEIKNLESKKFLAKDQEILKTKYEAYLNIVKELDKAKEEKEKIDILYPKGLPTLEELNLLKEYSQDENTIISKIKNFELTEEELNSYNDLESIFKNNHLNENEIATLREKLVNKNQAIEMKKNNIFSSEEKLELAQLKNLFKDDSLNEEKIILFDEKVLNYLAENKTLGIYDESIPTNISRIKDVLSIGIPTENRLNEINDKIKNYTENKEKIEVYNNEIYNLNNHKPIGALITLSLLSLLAIITGVVLTFYSRLLGISFISLGFIILLLDLVLLIKDNNKIFNQKSKEEIVKLKANNNAIASDLRAFFANYRMASDNFSTNYEKLKDDISTLKEYEEKRTNSANSYEANLRLLDEKKNEIILFYKKYDIIASDLSRLPILLKDKLNRYKELLEKQDRIEKLEDNAKRIIEDANKTIISILDSHQIFLEKELDSTSINKLESDSKRYLALKEKKENFSIASINFEENTKKIKHVLEKYDIKKVEDFTKQYVDLKQHKANYSRLENLLVEIEKRLDKYSEYKNIDIENESSLLSNEENIEEDIRISNQNLALVGKEIEDIEEKLSSIDDLNEEITKIKEKQNDSKNKLKKLKILQECFFEAENNLKEKYIGPMEASFIKYVNKINSKLSLNAKLDYNFNLKYDLYGKEREYKHLSEGQKACLALCMRFAMIENMYKEEKLFIVLDDPFINLDEKNLEKCLNVLNDLASEMQIIYFCCHKSRIS